MTNVLRSVGSELVGVIEHDGARRVVAVVRVAAGTEVYRIEGVSSVTPTRHSVQIGTDMHVDTPDGCSDIEMLDQYFWRYTNHHCEPNTVLRGQSLVAVCDIDPLEDVTFNYNTTEVAMATPFDCHCGAVHCAGSIRGASALTPTDAERLAPLLTPHIRRFLSRRPLA
ncbi:MAG: SET domain-containing protein [Gemmatimonadetes bacterium]|nr:SET domain-containing protein [Gemmatimonadota bacterium]